MARETYEREDLLRDARALVPRILLRVNLRARTIELFAGFRGESLSLYFGNDPVFHFNDRRELRRAFFDDELLKGEAGRMVALQRERTSAEVALVRRELDDLQQQQLLGDLMERLVELRSLIDAGKFVVVGEVPAEGSAVARLRDWLALIDAPLVVSTSPHVG